MPDLKTPPEYVPGHGLLRGKRVVVTAAAGTGIGFATAKKCVEEGATIFISDIHDGRLQKAAETLKDETGQRPGTAICSVTDQTEVDVLFEDAVHSMGGIDVVINNAGLGGTADLVDMKDEQWMNVLDVTLNGCFRINRAAMRYMKKSFKKTGEGGVIVNNASVLGWRAQKGQAHYAAAKAGVMALTRCAGLEGAEFGVRVNAIAPSLAMHEFLPELEAKEAYGRGSEVWEQANVIVFLASDYSSYMTGEVLSTSSQHA
jgi:3-oxoacyl-[acyl-carrier protein] reductase